MVEDTDEIILPLLRDIRGDMAKMANAMETLSVEMRAMRLDMRSITSIQDHDHADIAMIKSRLERVERRLDLTDN